MSSNIKLASKFNPNFGLIIAINQIGDEGAIVISKYLKSNKSLQILSLACKTTKIKN
jgi:hypothetical protein